MRRLLWIALPMALACGGAGMGEACEETIDCEDGGSCLSGVCSGYACGADEDCDNGYTCGDVVGTPVCVLACDDAADCGGDQTCTEVEEDTAGDRTASICL